MQKILQTKYVNRFFKEKEISPSIQENRVEILKNIQKKNAVRAQVRWI